MTDLAPETPPCKLQGSLLVAEAWDDEGFEYPVLRGLFQQSELADDVLWPLRILLDPPPTRQRRASGRGLTGLDNLEKDLARLRHTDFPTLVDTALSVVEFVQPFASQTQNTCRTPKQPNLVAAVQQVYFSDRALLPERSLSGVELAIVAARDEVAWCSRDDLLRLHSRLSVAQEQSTFRDKLTQEKFRSLRPSLIPVYVDLLCRLASAMSAAIQAVEPPSERTLLTFALAAFVHFHLEDIQPFDQAGTDKVAQFVNKTILDKVLEFPVYVRGARQLWQQGLNGVPQRFHALDRSHVQSLALAPLHLFEQMVRIIHQYVRQRLDGGSPPPAGLHHTDFLVVSSKADIKPSLLKLGDIEPKDLERIETEAQDMLTRGSTRTFLFQSKTGLRILDLDFTFF